MMNVRWMQRQHALARHVLLPKEEQYLSSVCRLAESSLVRFVEQAFCLHTRDVFQANHFLRVVIYSARV